MINTSTITSKQLNKLKQEADILIQRNYGFFLTGTFLVFSVLFVALYSTYSLYSGFFQKMADLTTSAVNSLSQVKIPPVSKESEQVKNAIINETYENKSKVSSEVVEEGQISSLASSKVTYSKDTYVVSPGDTLFLIAEKVYGDRNSWMKIASENNIKNHDIIEIGMTLKIPR